MHEIHKYNIKIVGSDSTSGLFRSSPRHVMKSAFYMMVLDEFKHTSIRERERERGREREIDSSLVFTSKSIVL